MILDIIREEKGLTQTELAQKIGVPVNVVRNWEEHKSFPTYLQLLKLVRLLDCSLDDLLCADGMNTMPFVIDAAQDFQQIESSYGKISPLEADLIDCFRLLNEEEKLGVLRLARSLADSSTVSVKNQRA